MRVIQIGVDILIDDSVDIENIKYEITKAVNGLKLGVMGIEQSDCSWSYDDYINGRPAQ